MFASLRIAILSLSLGALLGGAEQLGAPPVGARARTEEIHAKEERLRTFLAAEQLDGVLLGTQRNFAWLTAGGDNHVVYNTEEGVALLLWIPEKKYVIAANNEMPRFMAEELTGLDYEPAEFSWHEDISASARAELIARLTAGKRIGSDLVTTPAGLVDVAGKFHALRQQLVPSEIERYRWLARTAAEIVEEVARAVKPGQTEAKVQAEVARRLFARDVLPTVLLVAADDRIASYKHAITKDATVRREAMITLCARKWGMVAAVTRHVHFGELPREMRLKQEALGEVFAAMLGATRPGARAGAVIAAAHTAYFKAGYNHGWEHHHLGGALGYRERDYKAVPGSTQVVLDRQAFAWNPTLPGVKIEDTVLVAGEALEMLTDTGNWPREAFKTGGREVRVPQILSLSKP